MVLGICVALIAVIGMVALVNMILGFAGLSLEMIFGYVFCPFGYLMGFDTVTAMQEGTLLGQKLALNEFVAFGTLGAYISTLDSRTAMMCAISLAGFANVSSMGICIGGIGALCPEKKGCAFPDCSSCDAGRYAVKHSQCYALRFSSVVLK